MRIFGLILLFLTVVQIKAQENGQIVGKLLDKEVTNEPLAFANILIKGTTIGTTSDFDGLYELNNIAPGNYTLIFSYLGYASVEKESIAVISGQETTINITMVSSEGVALDEVVLTTSARKNSESALLLDQKKAVEMKASIGAQELTRKGISNAATAVTKISGISKQEGSNGIFVRGLGDRYNATTLNGLPLPSNNPSRKNIALEIFSTDIVNAIEVSKTYVVTNSGDFAGANINIVSKDYKGDGFLQIGAGLGANSEAISQKDFYLNEGPNTNGFYTKNYPSSPLHNYNFNTSWDRTKAGTAINKSFSIKGGDSYTLGEESRLNFSAVASFDTSFNFKKGVSRGSVSASGLARKDFNFTTYQYQTNTTLMANIGFRNKGNRYTFNSLYINSSEQKQQEFNGSIDAFDYAPNGGGFVQRATFDRTILFINQLLGKHSLREDLTINWGVSYNLVDNTIPNRRQVTLSPDNWDIPEGPKSFRQATNTSDNHRYYQSLNESELAANISASFKFSKNEENDFLGSLTFGYSGRIKEVDFESTQFNFNIVLRDASGQFITQPIVKNKYNVDAYFNQENLNKGLFTVQTFRGKQSNPNALTPQTYGGKQNIHAAFVSTSYIFSPKLTLIAGLRGEQISQNIKWSTALDLDGDKSNYNVFEILPMLSLKYALTEKQNFKLALSKTYTLPQYKERALFLFEGITQSSFGNPALYASTDYNMDIKWEIFPKYNELISLGAFAKYIQNPINDITVNSASNDISYVNSGDAAIILGGEFEIRKTLFKKEKNDLKSNLSAGFNTSYMYSSQDLDGEKVLKETTSAGVLPLSVDFSNKKDKLTGASDILVNADFSFFKDFSETKNMTATIAYSYFSDRIFSLGTEGKGNIIDKGIGSLDFTLRTKLSKNLELGLSAKNMLNPSIERVQDKQNVTVLSYKKGSNFKLTLSYNF
ncbi:MAG: TonB-dependent receptor [Cellulophaga sp.]